MVIKSITQRWIVNTLSVILLAIILVAVIFAMTMKNYYYNGVKQTMSSHANMVSKVLASNSEDEAINFTAELRSLVENSDEKNRMEITAIDHYGKISLSSSGFSYTQDGAMPDYDDAITSLNGTGTYIGWSNQNEKIMALTMLIPSINSEFSAIRYVTSLRQVDALLAVYMTFFLLVAVVMFAFVMISGLYFIKSIVLPVRAMGSAVRKFATGDMSMRVIKKGDDELGELCDLINYMADEIQTSENMKNEFISSVSHELRTPLTAIKGWSETISTDYDFDTTKKGMKVIASETERLSIMVEELLDFSRIQGGKLTLVKTRIDILAEVGEAVLIYTERAKRDGIELCYDEPEMLPFVFGDKNRLKQVFINIIDNALKYCDQGDTVTVKATEEPRCICIMVEDTGCGISKDDLPKIKTKFYKANYTRRGSGIGLAVADEIVALHGGTLTVESELGIGTTVAIRLPVSTKKEEMRGSKISSTMEFKIDSLN